MELIKEIYEKDLGISSGDAGDISYKIRKAARALLFRKGKIAVLHAVNIAVHKLPGGGVAGKELIKEGLTREIKEETGFTISDEKELGITIEYRNEFKQLQISYVYTGNAGVRGIPNFTGKEISEGFKLIWLTVEEAIEIMKNKDNPINYAGKFIHERDLAILEYYLASSV